MEQTPLVVEPRPVTAEEYETRNLLALAAQQIVVRIGWIFKTESVVMPFFMDAISGAGWLRGCLPVLNRMGQSVPPLLFAGVLRRMPHKRRALFLCTLLMAVPFLLLSAIWFSLSDPRQLWLAIVFLLLYLIFFSTNGIHLLAFGTLQGKLIQPHHRGRLLGISGTLGTTGAVIGAWLLLPRWLEMEDNGFGYIFLATGMGFAIAALFCLGVVEPADQVEPAGEQQRANLGEVWRLLTRHRDFRRLAVVAMLFAAALLLFPHYQALGRLRPQANARELMTWVIVQNVGVGLFSLVLGWLADRHGTRLALRITITGAGLTPLAALYLADSGRTGGVDLFWCTFFLIGLVPVTMRMLVNYALEIAPDDEHAHYVSTLGLCLALPFACSPGVGYLVDSLGFDLVFEVISALVLTGACGTLLMHEPRRKPG